MAGRWPSQGAGGRVLAPERRAALEERVAASPELAERLAEQERAVSLLRSAAAEVEAPATLRARLDARRRARARPTAPRLRDRRRRRCRARGRDRTGGFGSATSADRFHAASRPPTSCPPPRARRRSPRRPRLADRPRRNGAPPPRGRSLLPGVAAQHGGRARTDRLLQRRHGRHPVGGCVTVDYPALSVTREEADGDQASSGEGARGDGRHRRLAVPPARLEPASERARNKHPRKASLGATTSRSRERTRHEESRSAQ